VTASVRERASPADLLERELELANWSARNSLSAERYDLEGLLDLKRQTVSVVLPAREVGQTIASILDALAPLRTAGLVEEIVVVDATSRDGTAATAAERGAAVLQESEVLPGFGAARGKGDAMWRGLAATSGEIVVYMDTDTRDFDARFLLGMLGPLLERPELQFVKGTFRRPLEIGEIAVADGGGRVTELVARPLLNLLKPELGGFGQPLAGETAGRRSLLEQLPYPVGYGVEIGMLIDVAARLGIEAIAEVDLGTRRHRHQSLRELSAMALAVLGTALSRVYGSDSIAELGAAELGAAAIALPAEHGMELREVSLEERPPLSTLSADERRVARSLTSRSLEPGSEAEVASGGLLPLGSR
jgi:glucosyl-3-phosphoglycerate synthase